MSVVSLSLSLSASLALKLNSSRSNETPKHIQGKKFKILNMSFRFLILHCNKTNFDENGMKEERMCVRYRALTMKVKHRVAKHLIDFLSFKHKTHYASQCKLRCRSVGRSVGTKERNTAFGNMMKRRGE